MQTSCVECGSCLNSLQHVVCSVHPAVARMRHASLDSRQQQPKPIFLSICAVHTKPACLVTGRLMLVSCCRPLTPQLSSDLSKSFQCGARKCVCVCVYHCATPSSRLVRLLHSCLAWQAVVVCTCTLVICLPTQPHLLRCTAVLRNLCSWQ